MKSDDILKHFIDMGKITQADVDLVRIEFNDSFKRVVSNVHTLLCSTHHSSDGDGCNFYDEDKYDDCWKRPAHITWYNYVCTLMQKFKINDADEVSICINKARQLADLIKHVNKSHAKLTCHFLQQFISLRPDTDLKSQGGEASQSVIDV